MDITENTGYCYSEVRKELGEARYALFDAWMRGQTVGLSSDGEHLVYPWDYQRFLQGLPCID